MYITVATRFAGWCLSQVSDHSLKDLEQRENLFNIKYDTGLKNEEIRKLKGGGVFSEITVTNSTILKVHLKVKNNRVFLKKYYEIYL